MIKHSGLKPVDFIRSLFANTVDGRVEIGYEEDVWGELQSETYNLNWTVEDAEGMVDKYVQLTAMLEKFARLHDQLEEEAARKELLTAEEQTAWDVYIRPFDSFEVDDTVINELYFRAEFDSLDDEENELLHRHYLWRREQGNQRLPIVCRPAVDMIIRARRYECLLKMNAPQVVVDIEGCYLAEELVLYHHCPLVEVLE